MQLIAEKRTKLGKKTKDLRKQRKLPAVIFGKGIESIPITVDLNDFIKVFKEAGETNLIELKYNGNIDKVLVKEAQPHPVTSDFLHVNFHKVDLKEKIQADIPVEVVGEEENELVKSKEALPLLIINEITVEALPADLPDSFEVNVTGLKEIGDGITISELGYDRKKVTIVGYEDEDLVVKLDYAVQPEEEEEAPSEEEMLEQMEVAEGVEEVEEEGEETAKEEKKAEEPDKEQEN